MNSTNFACKEVSEARSLEPHPSDPSAVHYRTPSCAYEKMPELSRARAIALREDARTLAG
jgi:hypothetical protein